MQSGEATTFRMSIGQALGGGSGFAFVMMIVGLFSSVGVSWDAMGFLTVVGVFIPVSVLTGLFFRELLKVSVSSEGIGSKRRPMLWSEMNEVEHGRIMMGVKGFYVRSTYRPTVTIAESVAEVPAFRDAVERFSPADCPIRQVIADSSDSRAVKTSNSGSTSP